MLECFSQDSRWPYLQTEHKTLHIISYNSAPRFERFTSRNLSRFRTNKDKPTQKHCPSRRVSQKEKGWIVSTEKRVTAEKEECFYEQFNIRKDRAMKGSVWKVYEKPMRVTNLFSGKWKGNVERSYIQDTSIWTKYQWSVEKNGFRILSYVFQKVFYIFLNIIVYLKKMSIFCSFYTLVLTKPLLGGRWSEQLPQM